MWKRGESRRLQHKVFRSQHHGFVEDDCFLDGMPELPDIAWPAISHQFLLGNLKEWVKTKSASATVILLGPVYDLLGPQFFNVHLLIKAMKREFDPNNVSNPPYATVPNVIPPEQLAEMTKVL